MTDLVASTPDTDTVSRHTAVLDKHIKAYRDEAHDQRKLGHRRLAGIAMIVEGALRKLRAEMIQEKDDV
jgi:hypothetical protein